MGDEQVGRKDKVIQLRNQLREGWGPNNGKAKEYLANGEIGTVAEENKGWFNMAFAGRPGVM